MKRALAARERNMVSVVEKTSSVPAARAKRPRNAAIRQPLKAPVKVVLEEPGFLCIFGPLE
ncbi:MAG: hypothetical protein A3J24_06005 [Deltaproteobacteria bacterium RIFCSPLOWO2_02_FULL_53_8]|nr:MAG: hypothetical protein A3J24_06005 [Deltaproteobacteria bacterium RIFCSPLOWO2_02_FULL_53_8]